MKVDENEVKRIGKLARLELAQSEITDLTKDMNQMLDYVAKINSLDTSNVKETDHALDINNIFRPDSTAESIGKEAALKMAPEVEAGHFVVPAVIE